jgi:hypothetical protein
MDKIASPTKEVLGVAGSGKYFYQAGRAFSGLNTTTRLTAGMDVLSGLTGAAAATNVADAAKATSSGLTGVVGGAKISQAGKIASFAGKAAPVLTKGSAVLGGVLGGIEIGKGVYNLSQGNKQKGTDQLVSGGCDVVTTGALYVAATSSATVVGLPVAGVALAVAGVAQAGKYAYKYREQIGDAAKWVGNKVSDGAEWAGGKIAQGAGAVKKGAEFVGDKVSDGVHTVKDAAKAGRDFVGKKVSDGLKTAKAGARAVGDKVGDAVSEKVSQAKTTGKAVSKVLSGGVKRLKGIFD